MSENDSWNDVGKTLKQCSGSYFINILRERRYFTKKQPVFIQNYYSIDGNNFFFAIFVQIFSFQIKAFMTSNNN